VAKAANQNSWQIPRILKMKLYFVIWSNLNNIEAAERRATFLKSEQIHLKISISGVKRQKSGSLASTKMFLSDLVQTVSNLYLF